MYRTKTTQKELKQGVALTGRNTTGPPSRAAPGELVYRLLGYSHMQRKLRNSVCYCYVT